jgi:hypothetical protein
MPNDRAKRRGRDSLATETKSTTRVRLSAGLGSGAGDDAAPATGQKTPAGHTARTQSVAGRGSEASPACVTRACRHGGLEQTIACGPRPRPKPRGANGTAPAGAERLKACAEPPDRNMPPP